jgi:hypothetical protein
LVTRYPQWFEPRRPMIQGAVSPLGRMAGTNQASVRSSAMNRDIDAPADDLRDEAARTKREAEATSDPKKERLKEISKHDQAKAIDIENDVA